MSSDFLEKIRNIIVILFVIFFSFLIMLITFCSLRVHAAVRDLKISKNQISNIDEITYSFVGVADSIDIVAFCNSASDRTIKKISVFFLSDHLLTGNDVAFHRTEYVTDIKDNSVLQHYDSDWYFKELATYHLSDGRYVYGVSVYNFDSYETAFDGSYVLVDKIINSDTEMTKFLNDFYVNKTITPLDKVGSDFDPHDDAYAFTGFSMSGKTATWTGTTERSYLLDMDVEEWVNYTYGFATSEDQEVSSFIDAEAHYPTSDKKLALPWDEMEANKKEGEFIRQVNIIPCYGTSGAGFYFGLPCKVFYHKDGSVDKVELPTSNGILSSDMERPVIVLNEASNGNPVGGDYSYFRFNNAQEDYFIEMKGRWYSTNDFDIYRENLVWKYKYQTILKNDLSSWVSVSDNVNSVGSFRFDVLGKSSWENLLSLYPVDNRNYEGGSFALFNKITGYSDALDTLKMLLKQPYSLYNGYEIYVRYYRYDDNGNLQYSKWTHFYNNLADAAGSSGSRLDDLNNMYSENQSDKGLTDDELSDLENTGNSRNDLDAVPKNNYDYSSLENATMSFFDLLTNFGTMLGQFPSMVAAVFCFLPSWLIGLIAVAIGAVIVCRFIGR